ncbi:hypothetical protein BURPS668_1337 [Burkholderia pseudomallei 668]|uniref:Uncharacterized protein n=1 Tax=Burkholderia pseudomallei 1710a TaxID=320371 RepID=A0A0E1W5D5_BURPE|nr:hypothetical protein BURPS668_1337 [Burkholderia pseudomallei 668]EET07501.1 hypothetical protein BURPS1710A_1660 [Burkholderia pseudomallei 1710a]
MVRNITRGPREIQRCQNRQGAAARQLHGVHRARTAHRRPARGIMRCAASGCA